MRRHDEDEEEGTKGEKGIVYNVSREGEFNAQGVKVKVKGQSEWAASQREKGGVDYWSYVRLERTRETC